ncbi:LVIVD repeat-containing protein [Mesobacillus zeae]
MLTFSTGILGTIILNIEDPEHPKLVGRTQFERDVQGAAHSAALAHGGNILIETREIFNPDPHDPEFKRGWDYVRIYDIKDKSNPKLLSTFRTLNSVLQIKAGERQPGTYTVHDPKVRGNTLYLSHYSDGIRTVDITDPVNPVEVGSYVSDKANVWGVFVDRNYVLASDMGQGLKVLQKVGTGLR